MLLGYLTGWGYNDDDLVGAAVAIRGTAVEGITGTCLT